MKKQSLLFYFLFSFLASSTAQDTFSIIAVDPATGEVGGAGASCIDTYDCNGCGGVIIINNLLPGRGGMNSQATVCIPNINLNNGLNQLIAGLSPQEVLDWLLVNDGCISGNVNTRQYGIADFDPDGNPRAAGYTGANCLNYANHNTGDYYSIQGNILLGQEILDSMEQRFLNTEGPLAKRLMAALQGANVPGADTRCLSAGISSKSSFIRVARPDDVNGNFYLEINVPSVLPGVDPIDSLQTLFDEWYTTTLGTPSGLAPKVGFRVYPNPAGSELYIEPVQIPVNDCQARLLDMTGRLIAECRLTGSKIALALPAGMPKGIYLLEIRDQAQQVIFTNKIAH
ncbi:MAG: DUF1028 domain-containing protein [Lewinellaceae bacterium]|nr:DUF1028 domain-containing protein [Lewinellaceae bacterium]